MVWGKQESQDSELDNNSDLAANHAVSKCRSDSEVVTGRALAPLVHSRQSVSSKAQRRNGPCESALVVKSSNKPGSRRRTHDEGEFGEKKFRTCISA